MWFYRSGEMYKEFDPWTGAYVLVCEDEIKVRIVEEKQGL